ncbi:unnamed protein product [Dibothriocephalus latus]|uniref:Ig-like domain-containing protein n=1 Tax=Dibothriocephalus latus TaxID=60516 RepID=A0A3P7NV32_DIBLA|nr:unnamed protein product [Dibothriocephalus latus]
MHTVKEAKDAEWNLPDKLLGIQTRTVNCVMRNGLNDSEERVPDAYCQRISGNAPDRSQSCPNPICYRWGTVRFQRCSADCGPGMQVGELSCERVRLLASETPSDDGFNVGVTEVSVDDCRRHIASNISLVILPEFTPTVFSLENHSIPRLPQLPTGARIVPYRPGELIRLPCLLKPCPSLKPTWRTGSWSKCSADCGIGYQQRNVSCVLAEENSDDSSRRRPDNSPPRILPDEICLGRSLIRPSRWLVCKGPPCVFWEIGEWGECEGTCEVGRQKRRVRCLQTSTQQPTTSAATSPANSSFEADNRTDTREVEPSMCEDQQKPDEERPCPLMNDCPFWYKGLWSAVG